MPLGISESLIQRAYAPVDLSGFYKGLDEGAKLAAAEQKAEKKALQKEYYTDLAAAEKGKEGVREKDAPIVTDYFNKYKQIKLQLISNPKLKDRNPAEYYKKDAEAEDYLDKAKIQIKKSKDTTDFINKMNQSYLGNKNKFVDDFSQNVSKTREMSSDEIENAGLLDFDKWVYQGPDMKTYSSDINNKILKPSIVQNIKKKKKDTNYGTEIADVVNTIHPGLLQKNINDYVDGRRDATKLADHVMTDALKTGEVQRYWDAFNSLDDNELAKLKTADGKDMWTVHPDGTRLLKIPKPSGTTTADLKNFLFLKGIVDVPTTAVSYDKEFYPDGKEKVSMQVFKEKQPISFEWSKKRTEFAQKFKTVDTSLVDVAAGIYSLLGKDNDKANKAMQMIPNGYENGVYFYKADPIKYKNGYKAIAAKLGLSTSTDAEYEKAVKKINEKTPLDIATQIGVNENDVKSGIGTTGARDQSGNYKSRIFDNSDIGQSSFLSTNLTSFGSAAKKSAIPAIVSNISNLFEQPAVPKEKIDANVPSAKAKKKVAYTKNK